MTAACLAGAGHHVLGIDPDEQVVERLTNGHPPVSEPGLAELIHASLSRLRFTTEPHALGEARCAWVTFDTPVDDDDHADVEWVLGHAARLLASLPEAALVIVSSQLPVGSVSELEMRCAELRGGKDLRFACVPENLRLGTALESFRRSDRIVAGVRNEEDRLELAQLLRPFSAQVQWMGVESAEMTKHALNGFLAASVAFINEVAAICESVGADAADVSRGLKSEPRIGPRAYLGPGDAFAGGTLARDVSFLTGLAEQHGLSGHVFAGVAAGNAAHRDWSRRKLLELLGCHASPHALTGQIVAVWGLTYKPGTDTLRRSSAIELCRWLLDMGAHVQAHDPAVRALPDDLAESVQLCADPLQALNGAHALVACTPWPEYRDLPADQIVRALANALVIDPAGSLRVSLAHRRDLHYACVGMPAGDDPLAYRASAEASGTEAGALAAEAPAVGALAAAALAAEHLPTEVLP